MLFLIVLTLAFWPVPGLENEFKVPQLVSSKSTVVEAITYLISGMRMFKYFLPFCKALGAFLSLQDPSRPVCRPLALITGNLVPGRVACPNRASRSEVMAGACVADRRGSAAPGYASRVLTYGRHRPVGFSEC